jgi:hypothetical protein
MVILLLGEAAVASQRPVNIRPREQTRWPSLGNHPLTHYATIEKLLEAEFSVWSVRSLYNEDQRDKPCGGGVEYLHRDPASRRRRRKGKSQIWDSKIWSRVPRDSDLRKTALAWASSNCKRQTRPLVREGAPKQQTRNCQTIIKIRSLSPRWVLYSKTDWPADRRS